VSTRLRNAIRQTSFSSKSPEAVEVSVGLAAWQPGQDWEAVDQVADADLYTDKRRHKAARRSEPEPERPAIRLLGRGGGRRRVAGS
jgi:PleD family two-component response regulator